MVRVVGATVDSAARRQPSKITVRGEVGLGLCTVDAPRLGVVGVRGLGSRIERADPDASALGAVADLRRPPPRLSLPDAVVWVARTHPTPGRPRRGWPTVLLDPCCIQI